MQTTSKFAIPAGMVVNSVNRHIHRNEQVIAPIAVKVGILLKGETLTHAVVGFMSPPHARAELTSVEMAEIFSLSK